MSRMSISTPCPPPNAPTSQPGRRLSTASTQDDTTEIEYTRPLDLQLKNAKPRRKSTFKRRDQRDAPITIFEDVLEDEELAVESKRPLGGSTLLAKPAQKPMHRAVPRVSSTEGEKEQPLRTIGQAHGRVSVAPRHQALQDGREAQTNIEAAMSRTHEQTDTRARAGLKKEPRRRTIFVPSEDTTLLSDPPWRKYGRSSQRHLPGLQSLPFNLLSTQRYNRDWTIVAETIQATPALNGSCAKASTADLYRRTRRFKRSSS